MSQPAYQKALSVSERLYRILLRAYPAEHRREYGDSMLQLFRDLCRDAYCQGRLPGLAQVWIRTLWDVAKTVVIEHLIPATGEISTLRNRPVTPASWGKVILAILPGLLVTSLHYWNSWEACSGGHHPCTWHRPAD
jgi:hypothetical protein